MPMKTKTLIYLILLVSLLAACRPSLPPDTSSSHPTGEAALEPSRPPDTPLLPEKTASSLPEATASPESPPEDTMDFGTPDADVVFVRAVQAENATWTFHVTVSHPDTGWEDYADGWDVVTSEGVVLKPDPNSPFTRLLLHPHVDEQPFTRSQSGVEVPPDITTLVVRAHDLVSGFGGREVEVDLTVESGPDFEVVRHDEG